MNLIALLFLCTLIAASETKVSNAPMPLALALGLWWWINKRWGQATVWNQCFKFHSLLWHCWFGNRASGSYKKLCHLSKKVSSRTRRWASAPQRRRGCIPHLDRLLRLWTLTSRI